MTIGHRGQDSQDFTGTEPEPRNGWIQLLFQCTCFQLVQNYYIGNVIKHSQLHKYALYGGMGCIVCVQ